MPVKYSHVVGSEDVLMEYELKSGSALSSISKIQQNLPYFPPLAAISTYFLLIPYQNKLE